MPKRLVYGLALVGLCVVGLEALSRLSLQMLGEPCESESSACDPLLSESQREAISQFIDGQKSWYLRHDPDLGWINAAAFRHREDAGKAQSSPAVREYTQNSQRIRSRREYSPQPDSGTLRIAAFGDSFVHGDEATDSEVWSARIEAVEPTIEVLNMGVSGYGTDQAYLRYLRDGREFSPHIVILGVIIDDVWRNLNIFRPFLAPETGHQMTKPRFFLEGDKLQLLPNPLASLSDYQRLLDDPEARIGTYRYEDAFFPVGHRSPEESSFAILRLLNRGWDVMTRPQRPDPSGGQVLDRSTEAYAITLALIEAFAASVRESGSTPLILFFPERQDVLRRLAGEPLRYEFFLEDLGDRVSWIDVDREFAARAPSATDEDLFGELHYSPVGNELVARAIVDFLQRPVRGPTRGG